MLRPPVLAWLLAGAALLALACASTADARRVTRIMGGAAVTAEQYPFVVNMQYHFFSSWWAHACGGTLVTSRIIVSASSCYSGSTAGEWRARAGAAAAAGEGAVLSARRLVLHQLFDEATFDYDVALVMLAEAAPLSNSVGVALIAGALYILPDGAVVSALGWGALYENGPYAETLQHVTAALVSQAECEARMGALGRAVSARMLCAAGVAGATGACARDWGGPLVHAGTQGPVLVGVLSWAARCGDDYYPFVSARVSELSDWIIENAVIEVKMF